MSCPNEIPKLVRLEVEYERGQWFANVTLYSPGLTEIRAAKCGYARMRGNGLPEVNANTIIRECIARARENRRAERRR